MARSRGVTEGGGNSRVSLRGTLAGSNINPVSPNEGNERPGDQGILDEAKYRFKRAQEWEGDFLKLYNEDVKFANGDSDNGWQWPDNIKRDRDIVNRPCLTINKTKMHVLLLANESRQKPPAAKVRPVGDEVSFKAAQVWEGLVRHIEYVSDAQSVYTVAKESQLEGGMAYWLIQPDYEDDRSFNQELRIAPLWVNTTYLDCDIKRLDGSDALWGFIYAEYDRREFHNLFPNVALPPASDPGLKDINNWIRKNSVRVAEYYRIQLEEEDLIYLEDDDGYTWIGLEKDIPDRFREELPLYRVGDKGRDFKTRKVMNRVLQWFKIAGNEIVDRRDGSDREHPNLKGRYIPIIRMPGRERNIEGKLYRAGLVRGLKDAQRMYNFNTSGEVEVVALQTKTPWIVAAESIEGNEAAWANANKTNAAYLTFRSLADDGATQIAPPQRMQPPTPAQGFLEGLRIAAAEMEMSSGQYQSQFQNPTVERTPQAVDQRQRMGELANYDFTYNEMQAVRHTAVVLIDLMPHYYDTKRVVKIKAEDGTISEIAIDPQMDEAYREEKPRGGQEEAAVKVLFNPKVGKYAVEADVGPRYQTQREAAWEAFKELIKGSPEMMNIMGDLGFLAADFPMADKIAERLRRHIEATAPWLLDDSKTGPVVAKLQEAVQKSEANASELMTQLAEVRMKLRGKDELRDIEAENAKSKRLVDEAHAAKELVELGEGHGLKKLVQQTIAELLGFDPNQIEKANKAVIAERSRETASAGNGGADAQA